MIGMIKYWPIITKGLKRKANEGNMILKATTNKLGMEIRSILLPEKEVSDITLK